MRSSVVRWVRIRAIPASQIPAGELRLPPKDYKAKRSTNQGNPTIDAAANLPSNTSSDASVKLPSNLRLEEFIPPRQLYANISESDREIVSFTCYASVVLFLSCSIDFLLKLKTLARE